MKTLSIPAVLIAFSTLAPWACQATREASAGNAATAAPETAAATAPTHLHLVLRVGEKGTAEVVSAAEVPGDPVLSDAYDGPYLWQASRDGAAVATGSLPDPFASRGFAPPGSRGEAQSRQEVATIVIKIPDIGLSGPLASLSVQLFHLRPAPDGSAVPKIDAETVERLRQAGRLEPVARLAGADLAAQIRKVGRKSAD